MRSKSSGAFSRNHTKQSKSKDRPPEAEGTEKVKSTFRLKVNGGEIVVLPFFFCLT